MACVCLLHPSKYRCPLCSTMHRLRAFYRADARQPSSRSRRTKTLSRPRGVELRRVDAAFQQRRSLLRETCAGGQRLALTNVCERNLFFSGILRNIKSLIFYERSDINPRKGAVGFISSDFKTSNTCQGSFCRYRRDNKTMELNARSSHSGCVEVES